MNINQNSQFPEVTGIYHPYNQNFKSTQIQFHSSTTSSEFKLPSNEDELLGEILTYLENKPDQKSMLAYLREKYGRYGYKYFINFGYGNWSNFKKRHPEIKKFI